MIELKRVTKIYQNKVMAVSNLSLKIAEGETLVLVGTSGCGKTTTMKMINRLIEPTEGQILIDGEDNKKIDLIELRRNIGYVIQEIGLFPHMTIEENIALVPKLKRWKKERWEERVRELLEMVGLNPEQFVYRYPSELSGGQQQRIGVARALAADPPIILMDEPFGALDPITREQLQEEFIQLKKRLKKTIVFVTHDIFEAVQVGDRIGIMDKGKILQADKPEVILKSPANELVNKFLGKHKFHLLSVLININREEKI